MSVPIKFSKRTSKFLESQIEAGLKAKKATGENSDRELMETCITEAYEQKQKEGKIKQLSKTTQA